MKNREWGGIMAKTKNKTRTISIHDKDANRIKKIYANKQYLANQLTQMQISLKAQDEAINILFADYINKGEKCINYDIDTNTLTIRKE